MECRLPEVVKTFENLFHCWGPNSKFYQGLEPGTFILHNKYIATLLCKRFRDAPLFHMFNFTCSFQSPCKMHSTKPDDLHSHSWKLFFNSQFCSRILSLPKAKKLFNLLNFINRINQNPVYVPKNQLRNCPPRILLEWKNCDKYNWFLIAECIVSQNIWW